MCISAHMHIFLFIATVSAGTSTARLSGNQHHGERECDVFKLLIGPFQGQ